MRRCGLLALLVPLGGMGVLEPAPVWLWGEPEPRMLEVVGVGAQGLTVRSGDGTGLIGWPDVRDAGVDEAGAWLGAARDVWRARTRLARGDHVTAEPLLERAAGDYLGGTGPMSASIADGLLRCRLRRGAYRSATVPWLALTRADGAGGRSSPAVDGRYGLARALPPLWHDAEASGPASDWRELGERDGHRRMALLEAWYRLSLDLDGGRLAGDAAADRIDALLGTLTPTDRRDQGLELVGDIVAARSPAETVRRRARDALELRLKRGAEPWLEVWLRIAIGRSLLLEADADTRRLGVISLLHVPARLAGVDERMVGLALTDAARALAGLGDDGAETLLEQARMLSRSGVPSARRAGTTTVPEKDTHAHD